MFGWRGRLGYLAPSTAERVVPEFYRFAPEGVALIVATLTVKELTDDEMNRALAQVEEKTRHLVETGVDAIFMHGVNPVIVRPGRFDLEIGERMRALSGGLPCAHDLTVVLEALQHLGIKRMVVGTPFDEDQNALLRRFLEGAGCTILAMRGLGVQRLMDIRALPEHAPYRLARALVEEAPEADGIYLPCGEWGNPHIYEQIEHDLHRPLVSSIQLPIWWGLRTLGITGPIAGFGQLLRSL